MGALSRPEKRDAAAAAGDDPKLLFLFPPQISAELISNRCCSLFFVSRFQRPEPEEVGLEGIPVTAHSNATVFVFTLRLVTLCAAALTPPVCGSRRGSGGEGERGGWCRRCCALKTRETKDQRLRLDFTRRTVAQILLKCGFVFVLSKTKIGIGMFGT